MEKERILSYKDLKVWQRSIELVKAVYEITSEFPSDEQFGLISQMRRAAVAVPSNIAEGYKRRSLGDYLRFLQIADGSAAELETQIIISRGLKGTNDLDYSCIDNLLEEVLKMLSVLISKLKKGGKQGGR
jgi:four helix bundle protein